MANTIRIKFKSFLPRPGFSTDGDVQQTKQEVVGDIIVSSYARNGETLTPSQLDLFSIDYIKLEVVDGVKSPGKAPRFAAFVHDVNQFYVFDRGLINSIPDTQVVEAAAGEAVTISFNAFGPARTVPEL